MRERDGTVTDAHDDSCNEVFGAYAGFYDALYADKDYAAECDFIADVFAAHGVPDGGSVLDLGCGTGGHAMLLAERGFAVTGVDRSPAMIELAQAKIAENPSCSADFLVDDVRSVDAGTTFDAVISMFAVVSYQLTDDDIIAMFSAVRRHLAPGGVFLFDVWFGPAVLVEQPEPRTKCVVTPEGDTIVRDARPTLDILGQTVEVSYDVRREAGGEVAESSSESHKVRFLFAREIEHFLGHAGMELVTLAPFMELDRTPTTSDWNVSVVARAI